MTDKLVGGIDPGAAASAAHAAGGKESSLAEKLGSGSRSGTGNPMKKTVKDMPSIDMDAGQTRRLTLDRNTSYGMKVRRPPSDESGSYTVVSAPSAASPGKTQERVDGLLCQSCGEVSKHGRLTCVACGNYFTSTVQDSDFERSRQKARRTQELGRVIQEEELTWQAMMLKRVVARVIDLAIVLSGFAVVMMSYLSYANGVIAEDASLTALFDNVTYCVFPGVLLLVLIVYSASFEGSLAQATPGKIAVGLVVTDSDGKELSFSRAFGRALVTYMPVALTVMTIWFTRLLNPALESLSMDKLWYASQAVVLVGVFGALAYTVGLFSIAGDRQMRSIFDLLSSTRVKQR